MALSSSADGGDASIDFVKIADWKQQPDEHQKAVYSDGKIWFFGQKFLDQPTYHWGHHVIFGGASVDFFDLPNNQWSSQGPTALPALAAAEHLDEVLFVFKSNIYLLLYSHFGQLYPYSLHQFVPEERRWRSIVHFASAAGKAAEVAPPPESSYKNTLVLVDGPASNGIFFVSYSDHKIGFHMLDLSSATSSQWTDLLEESAAADLPPMDFVRLQPTQAAHVDGTIFVLGGMHGCGFRWQPDQLIRFEIGTKSTELIEFDKDSTTAEKPTFSYMGPFAHAILPSTSPPRRWLHFAGNNAVGLTGSAFNGQCWALRLEEGGRQPSWERLPVEVPRPAAGSGGASNSNVHILFVPGQPATLVVASGTLDGILKTEFTV